MKLRLLLVLAGLGTVAPLATDMYLPSFPELAVDLNASATTIQLTLSAFMLGLAGGQLLLGTLSDRWGRKGLLVAGTAVLAASSVLCAVAPNVEVLVVARLLQGLSGSAGMVVGRAVAADLTHGNETARIYSILAVIGGVAPALAPAAGALIAYGFGWRGIFVVMTGLALLMFLGAVFVVPESLPAGRRHRDGGVGDAARLARGILTDRQFLGYGLIGWFAFGAMFSYISASSFVVQQVLGLSAAVYTLIFGINAAAMTAVGIAGTAVLRRVSPRRVLRVGLVVLASGVTLLVVAALAGLAHPAFVLPGFGLVAVSMSLIIGNATALAVQRARHAAGTALALIGCVQFAVAALVSPLVSLSGEGSIVAMALTMAGCLVLVLLGYSLTRGPEEVDQLSPQRSGDHTHDARAIDPSTGHQRH